MRLRNPDAIELEYAQQMMAWLLFLSPSVEEFHVVQLGLGAAALCGGGGQGSALLLRVPAAAGT